MSYLVYLAGPITGLSYDGANDWRDQAQDYFVNNAPEIEALSPLRAKDYLSREVRLADQYTDQALSNQRGITARDRFDCMRASAVLVNVLGAKDKSAGTIMEVAWADAVRTPIILVMEEEGNPHDHSMIRECCSFRVCDLHNGLWLTRKILLP